MPHLSSSLGDFETLSSYCEECRRNRTPYVICHTRETLADISYSFEPLDEPKREILRKNTQAMAEFLDNLSLRYPHHQGIYRTLPDEIQIASMPRADAEAAAKEIFDFMSKLLNTGDETALNG